MLTAIYDDRWLRQFLYVIAAAYAYGGVIHVLNMLGLSGFDWTRAPFKWQALDVGYLVLDVAVVVGVLAKRGIGIVAFVIGAASQIVLYTLVRDWILDVPADLAPAPGQEGYFGMLVAFHAATLIAFLGLVMWRRPAG